MPKASEFLNEWLKENNNVKLNSHQKEAVELLMIEFAIAILKAK